MTTHCPRCARRHALDAPCLAGVAVVCGGRDYADRARVYAALDRLAERVVLGAIRHGAATGADALADSWATERRVRTELYPADWTRGKRAGPERNERMLRADPRPACVVAFPGGRGTGNCVRQAEALGIRVWRVSGNNDSERR